MRIPLPIRREPQTISTFDRFVMIGLALLTIVTRVPFWTSYLFEGDSVNFALSMEHYDVSQYRPHPPGYILFVGVAKVFALMTRDNNQALVAAAGLFSLITVLFLYLLGRDMFSRKVGLLASAAFLFVPIFWFHGEVALSYTGGACFSVLVAYCAYRILIDVNKSRWIYIAAGCLGLSGGIRQDILLFLMPLLAFSILMCWEGWKVLFRAAAILVVAFAVWYVPMIFLSNGYAAYSKALNDQFSYYATEYSVLFGNPLFKHFIMVKDLSLVFLGSTIFVLIYTVLYVSFIRKRPAKWVTESRLLFLIVWVAPSVAFLAIVFYQQPGYVLTPLPALYIALGYMMATLTEKFCPPQIQNRALWMQIIAITLVHTYMFLGHPALALGGAAGKPFEEKSWKEALTTMAFKAFYRHTDYTAHASGEATRIYAAGIRGLDYKPDQVTVLVFHRSPWSASLAFYYLPEYAVYYVQDYKPLPDKIKFGKDHWIVDQVKGNTIRLTPSTRCVVAICEDSGPTCQLLAAQFPMKRVQLENGLLMFLIEQIPMRINFKNIVFTNEQSS